MLTYELCKRLKEAGFPQDTKFDLLIVGENAEGEIYEEHPKGSEVHEDSILVSASPTLEELIDACGDKFLSLIRCGCQKCIWRAECRKIDLDGLPIFRNGQIPIEAVANLYLALNEKKV